MAEIELKALQRRLDDHAKYFRVGPYAPPPKSEPPPLPEVSPGEIVAGVVLLFGAIAAAAYAIDYFTAQAVAVEAAKAANQAGGVIFQCITDSEAAKSAAWQLVTHLDKPGGELMQTAAQVAGEIRGGGFLDVAGTIFQRLPGREFFSSVWRPPGSGLLLSDVIEVCPAAQIVAP